MEREGKEEVKLTMFTIVQVFSVVLTVLAVPELPAVGGCGGGMVSFCSILGSGNASPFFEKDVLCSDLDIELGQNIL